MNKDKILKLAKGFRGRGKNCIRVARERVEKSLQYAFRDRKAKKRDMRSLWIQRINAGARQYGVRGLHARASGAWGCSRPPSPRLRRGCRNIPHAPPLQIKYSQLVSGLASQNITINRKVLSELAQSEPYSFKALVDQVAFMRGLPRPGAAAAASVAKQ